MKIKHRTRLYSIAQQCPLTGGGAVYWARSLYAQYQPDATYDDKTTCEAIGLYSARLANSNANTTNNAKEIRFSISPNPVSHSFELISNETLSTMVTVQICDMAGKVMHLFQINNSNSNIDVSALNAGMYQIKINYPNQKTQCLPLIKL